MLTTTLDLKRHFINAKVHHQQHRVSQWGVSCISLRQTAQQSSFHQHTVHIMYVISKTKPQCSQYQMTSADRIGQTLQNVRERGTDVLGSQYKTTKQLAIALQ